MPRTRTRVARRRQQAEADLGPREPPTEAEALAILAALVCWLLEDAGPLCARVEHLQAWLVVAEREWARVRGVVNNEIDQPNGEQHESVRED